LGVGNAGGRQEGQQVRVDRHLDPIGYIRKQGIAKKACTLQLGVLVVPMFVDVDGEPMDESASHVEENDSHETCGRSQGLTEDGARPSGPCLSHEAWATTGPFGAHAS
jgi:hypothetical protein